MSGSEADEANLASIFGGNSAQASRIPEDLRPILLNRWSSLRQQLDASRPSVAATDESGDKSTSDPIARIQDLETEVKDLKKQLIAKNEEKEIVDRQLEDMHSSYSLTRQKSVSLEESVDKLKTENAENRRLKENFSSEVEDLRGVADRRKNEIESLHEDCKRLTDQLASANAAKCDALLRVSDIEAKEISIKHREDRLEQERELFEERLRGLSEDLRQAHENASLTRRELSAKIAQLDGELSQKTEEIRITEGRTEGLIGDKKVLQSRLDDVIERLKDVRDSKSNLEEGFRQEVRAQTNLAELYKKQAEDAEEKSIKLSEAITELQGLLKQAGDRYGSLEDHFEKEKVEHKDELKRRNDAIRALRKELTDANELIDTLKHRGLTEEGIAALSPAAAAASKLIKSGMSLTQVYTQLVTCQEELLAAEDEKRRLNSYLEQILSDIEQRAPALKKQRDEYDRAVATVNDLSKQIEELRDTNQTDSEAVANYKRKWEVSVRDADRLTKLNKDLGQQVACLIREVEAARFGRTARHAPEEDDDAEQPMDADGAISDRLVTFKNVQELQEKNAELLVVIREISSKHESQEAKLVEERTADLKKELDDAKEQLEDLTEARRRQEVLVENIILQRDMYKSMAEAGGSKDQQPPPSTLNTPLASSTPAMGSSKKQPLSSPGSTQAEVRAAKAEAALEEIKKDFDVYREEKCNHEKMLDEALETARAELTEARNKVIKFTANEEWNTERFKIAQDNNASYKKEIAFLEEKTSSLGNIVAKHEQSIQAMHHELVQANTQTVKLTNQYERARQELEFARTNQARLEKECEILNRQKSGSSMIAENLKLVQVQLEKAESEARIRLQNQNDDLSKEVNLLRKKLEHEQESYHNSVKAWESTQNELRTKVDTLKENENTSKAQIEDLTNNLDEVKHQLKISQEKLALMQPGANTGVVDSEKVVDLQSQVNALKNELVSNKEHLAKARQATKQYAEIATASEKQAKELNETATQYVSRYEDLLSSSNEEQKALKNKIALLEAAKNDLETQTNQGRQVAAHGAANVQQLEATIVSLNDQLRDAQARQSQMEEELSTQVNQFKEAQESYHRELKSHSQTANNLKQLKGTIKKYDITITELTQAKKVAESGLQDTLTDLEATESSLRSQYGSLKEQFETVEQENKLLHDQLANITTQMASLQQATASTSGGSADVASASFNLSQSFSEEEAKSMDQLMEIIKYLRQEKAILTGKVEVSQAETIRLKAQFESVQNQLSETQNALTNAQEKANSEILPSSKYSQLLEKVQTIPALSDSNRILRDERDRLKLQVENFQTQLKENRDQMIPMQEQLKVLQENEDKANAEMTALKADNARWRNRVNQLIEKHQKISPEEMNKVQNENSTLKSTLAKMNQEQSVSNSRLTNMTNLKNQLDNKVKISNEQLATMKQELQNAKTTNQQVGQRLNLKTKELEGFKLQVNALNAEQQKLIAEKEGFEKSQQEQEANSKQAAEKHAQEIKTVVDKNNLLTTTVNKLKTLGRNLKEKNEKYEKEVGEKSSEIEKLKEEVKKAQESAAEKTTTEQASSGSDDPGKLEEVETLLQESAEKIDSLEKQVEELKEKNEKIESDKKKMRDLMVVAKTKIGNLEEENKNLKSGGKEPAPSTADALASAAVTASFEEKIQELETALAKSKSELQEKSQQFEKLQKQRESQEAKLAAMEPKPHTSAQPSETVTGMVKPVVSVSGGQQPQRTKAQPQAQVQPTRHAVQVPQTATIRPTQQVRTTVRPNTAIASVSPSSAALNPNAAEFVPTSGFASGAEAAEAVGSATVEPASASIPPPLATVQPRQSSEEPPASTIMPSTSSGAGVPVSQASVAPTLKRPREADQAADQLEDESAKKAREEPVAEIVLSSSDEDEEEDITDVEDEEENVDEDVKTESEEEFEGGEIEAAVDIPDESVDVDDVEVDDDMEEDDEEVPDVDDVDVDEPVQSEEVVLLSSEDEEVEEENYTDEHFPPMEETLEQEQDESPSQIEESGGAIVPQMSEPMLMASEQHHVIADSTEPLEEESSNVPSDEQAAVPSSQQVGQFDDATDDSVVPSTPKLSSTTEKPSSPQVPSFFGGAVQTGESSIGSTTTSSSTTPTFAGLAAQAAASSSVSSGVKGASQEGIDRTAVDLSPFSGSGNNPSTSGSSGAGGIFGTSFSQQTKSIFGGTSATSTQGSTFGSAPLFGGQSSRVPVVKPAALSTIASATPTTTAMTSEVVTLEEPTSETSGQPQIIQPPQSETTEKPSGTTTRGAPRITRTPIVWSSPPGSSQGTQPSTGASTSTAPAPVQRGRGAGRARRSGGRPRGGTRGGVPRGGSGAAS